MNFILFHKFAEGDSVIIPSIYGHFSMSFSPTYVHDMKYIFALGKVCLASLNRGMFITISPIVDTPMIHTFLIFLGFIIVI
jgi:hypothetical protein